MGALCLLFLAADRAAAACPNEAFRSGMSAALPDCRAYELVTPADMNGRSIYAIESATPFNVFPTELASPLRDSALWMTQGAPLREPAEPSGTYDQYESVRTAAGWRTVRRLTPNGAQAVFPVVGGVSQDHSYTFTRVPSEQAFDNGSLAEDGTTTYLGNPDGSFELLGIGTLGSERLARGRFISVGGEHIIFTTGPELCVVAEPCTIAQLQPEAPPTGTPAVYDRAPDGPTHVISLLPGDVPPAAGEAAEYQGTSADGSVVAFKVAGVLYVRVDNDLTEEVTSLEATFAGLSSNGGALFYLNGGNIHRFDVGSEGTEQLNASGDAEVVNVSADGSRVYFVSPSQLDGSKGTAGQPNLYLWSTGTGAVRYVATVSAEDLEGQPALNTWTSRVVWPDNGSEVGPGADSSRTTPDGGVLAFESRARLTSYENEGHREIYRYEETGGTIQCVSCNPLAPPTANAHFEDSSAVHAATVIHNLSADGSRVFFETPEALLGRDTDGINDIYEWQEGGPGEAPSLALISSGQTGETSRPVNVIFSVTPKANDVIFSALEQLVPDAGVNGVPALFDARVDGGFAESLGGECVGGEACRPSAQPPSLAAPQSAAFRGKGNVRRHKHRCRHPKHGKRSRKRSCNGRKRGGSR